MMAGRGRVPPMLHGPIPHGGPGPFGRGVRPLGHPGLDVLPPSSAIVEEKLATQHAEIQRLVTENQRLAATHVALRQELAAAQHEVGRLQQVLEGIQSEKDQRFRALAEKSAKMETELRALEPLKMDLQRVQADAQSLHASRQELSAQVQQLNQELVRIRLEAQQVPRMQDEFEGLRQEIQRARTAFEFEKKANTDLLEQRAAMEKNLVSMAREVEKLRADLTNAEKKARGYGLDSTYGGGYEGSGMGQMGSAAGDNVSIGATTWGAYDMQWSGASTRR